MSLLFTQNRGDDFLDADTLIHFDSVEAAVRQFSNPGDSYFAYHLKRYTMTFSRLLSDVKKYSDVNPQDTVVVIGGKDVEVSIIPFFLKHKVVYSLAPDNDGSFMTTEGAHVFFLKADMETDKTQIRTGSVDMVICLETLEHLIYDPAHLMLESRRILRKGGYFVATTPNANSWRIFDLALNKLPPNTFPSITVDDILNEMVIRGVAHVREYGLRDIAELFSNTGYTVKSHFTFSPYPEEHSSELSMPDVRTFLHKHGLIKDMDHTTHYVFAIADIQPLKRFFPPLYSFDLPKYNLSSFESENIIIRSHYPKACNRRKRGKHTKP